MPKTTATRTTKSSRDRATLHLASELSLKVWKLAFATSLGGKQLIRDIPARDLGRLNREIDKALRHFRLASTTAVVSCYEAGRDGFWLHRFLEGENILNHVVDPSSVEVKRRGRSAKTDRLDVRRLLTTLIRYQEGEPAVWTPVTVPEATNEDARNLHRSLRSMKKERTRLTNRITGLLIGQGVYLEKLPSNLPDWLAKARLWDGSELGPELQRRLGREHALWAMLDRQIKDLETQQRKALRHDLAKEQEQARRLIELKGVGLLSAWTLVHEIFAWREIRSRRQLGGLAGLTPVPHQSGDEDQSLGISKAGITHVRFVAIELAWSWIRHQPRSALSPWYEARFARGGGRARKIGIVAVARKLLIALWHWLEHGVIPEGAELKTTA